MKTKTTTIVLVVVACLTLKAAESREDFSLTTIFSKPAERAVRSIQPRQSNTLGNCTQQQLINIYADYPSDCARVLQSASSANLMDAQVVAPLYSTLCKPRCNRAFARFYFECGFEALGEVFIQLCSTNANNERCYNLIGTLTTDATRVQSSCPTGGSSCPSSCQSSILTYRDNVGCCVNVFNTSALTEVITSDDYSLWASCSVETPGFCTQSTVSRPTSVDGDANISVGVIVGISVGVTVGAIVLFVAIIICVIRGVRAAAASSRHSHSGSSSTTYPQTTYRQTTYRQTTYPQTTYPQTTYPQSYTAGGTNTIDKQALLPAYTEQTTDAYPAPYPSQPQNT